MLIGFGVPTKCPEKFQNPDNLLLFCIFLVFLASKVWMFPVLDIGFFFVNHL